MPSGCYNNQTMIKINQSAPNFTLLDQTGQSHSLSHYKGKWVLLYFYPKDDTPGCTTEACQIRDNFAEFRKKGIVVLGVSCDSVKKHDKFAKKFALPFALLADEDKKVVELYGVWGEKKFPPASRLRRAGMGREYMGILRTSFLINPEGKVAKVYESVKPDGHAAEILQDVEQLQA